MKSISTNVSISPDLNPIENAWSKMKFIIATKTKADSQDAMVLQILESWAQVNGYWCDNAGSD